MEDAWEEQCRRIVTGVLEKRGWRLVEDAAQFADEIRIELEQRGITSADTPQARVTVERATVRHYCCVLYRACGEAQTPRQRLAFEELWRYLYPIALSKTHDPYLAQDAAQETLVKTWKSLGRCKEPGSFLYYAMKILLNGIGGDLRKKRRHGEITEWSIDLDPDPRGTEMKHSHRTQQDSAGEPIGASPPRPPSDLVIEEESRRELAEIIRGCLKNSQQQAVLLKLFLEEKGYKEIAEELEVTVGNVHVLRHRALAALQKCKVFIAFLEDRSK